jgi:hypothetical protein
MVLPPADTVYYSPLESPTPLTSFPDYQYSGRGTRTYHESIPGADTTSSPYSNDYPRPASSAMDFVPQQPTTTTHVDPRLMSIRYDAYDIPSPGTHMNVFDPSTTTTAVNNNAATTTVAAQNQAPTYAQAGVGNPGDINDDRTPYANEFMSLSPE